MIIRLIIVLGIVAIAIAVYLGMDRSKEAMIARERRKAEFSKDISEKIADPISRFLEGKISSNKVKNTIARYERAGIRISYAGTLLLSLLSGLLLATLIMVSIHNPFMAVVMFIAGWAIPPTIVGYLVNKRLNKLDEQIGMFMRMTVERFKVTNSFYNSMTSTVLDMRGEEPIYGELARMVAETESGFSISDAMHRLADRIGNKYMRRFADYYEITTDIGTKEARENVLEQAVAQYQHHIKTTRQMKKELSELTMEAYIMLAFVPVVVLYQISQDETYIPFMTETVLGKVGSAAIVLVWLICFWIVGTKLGAPIEEEEALK